jgi:Rieske Fe-S protein
VWLYTEDDEKFTAYSGVCTHLGCSYTFDTEKKRYRMMPVEVSMMPVAAPRDCLTNEAGFPDCEPWCRGSIIPETSP